LGHRIDIENVKKLFSKRSSKEVFCGAFKEIVPRKDNYGSFICVATFALAPAMIIAISNETIDLFVKAVETFNGIILTLFGIVFTGYAFFQALINDDLLIRLMDSSSKTSEKKAKNSSGKSKLQESNEYFVNIMMLDVFAIFISSFLLITVGSLDSSFSLPLKVVCNNTIAFIGMYLYFITMFCIVWEMKSFVFNIFQLFNAHAGSKAIQLINHEKTEDGH
jgi:hypothetical protein